MSVMRLLVFGGIFLAIFLAGCTLKPPPNATNGTKNESCICTLEYNPVCGADGKTYGNACGARCANVSVSYPGECRACADSDGGKDLSVKGTATDNAGTHSDSCGDSGEVVEFFCEDKVAKSEEIDCPSGQECKDGSCVAMPPPPAMTCQSFCPTQPHIECVGTWNISGTFPNCNCGFVCDAEPPPPENQSNLSVSTLRLFSGLQPLALGHYELWAMFGSNRVSVAKFDFGNDLKFDSKIDLSTAQSMVVTIEPEGDTDSTPGIIYLSGEMENGDANLSFGTDFSAANGTYVLMSPTLSGSNEESGVWFMTGAEPHQASLKLPELPQGWVYEGWVIYKGVPLSTGRFIAASGSDNSNFYCGSGASPQFPGEDFVKNAPQNLPFPANLLDGSTKVAVSVEPGTLGSDPTGSGPFVIMPLMAEIPDDFLTGADYQLERNLLAMPPTGEVMTDSKAGDLIACTEFCPAQPHDSCIGSWNITGDHSPGCTCHWKCRGPTD